MGLVNFLRNNSYFINVSFENGMIDFYISESIIPKKRKGWKTKSLSKSSVILNENDERKVKEFVLRLPPLENYKGNLEEDVKKSLPHEFDFYIEISITSDPGGGKTPHVEFLPTGDSNQIKDVEFAEFVEEFVEESFDRIY